MNNKIIAAGVVVALCAVALIGVGYAYTATVTNSNTITSEYVVLKINNGTGFANATFDGVVKMNTVTTNTETTWSVDSQDIINNGQNLRVTAVGLGVTEIALELKTTLTSGSSTLMSSLLGTGASNAAKIIFTKVGTIESDGTITSIGSGETITYTNGESGWSCSENEKFDINGAYSVLLKTSSISTTTAPDSTVTFGMELKYIGS